MGLGSFKSAWQRQTLHFGHEHADKYTVLIIDNRGMGDSDAPLMRYSTSEMARDAIEVLEHVGWLPLGTLSSVASASASSASSSSSSSSWTKTTKPPPQKEEQQQQQQAEEEQGGERTLHVIGISMGGMIAQEVAYLVPGAISSLNLCCTAAAIENTTTFWENMVQRAQMLLPKSLEDSVRSAARNTFPPAYLVEPDTIHLPTPSSATKVLGPHPDRGGGSSSSSSGGGDGGNGDGVGGGTYLHFDNNYARFVAGEMHKRFDAKRFTTKGFLLQLIAAGWHHKSPAQLRELADRVGRARILVLHGTADRMISVPHGYKLREYLGGGGGTAGTGTGTDNKEEEAASSSSSSSSSGLTAVIVEGMGHVPPLERTEWFHALIEERIRKGEALDGR